jgi:cbb3-type cytochrome oxidase cytochrome c subunit
MPLLPIDLQIMFSQLSHVGKEQAVQRDVMPQYQFVQGTEMVQKAAHDDSAVNQSQQVGEGPEKTKKQEEREKRKHSQGQANSDMRDSGSDEEKQIFEDPDLGHHVDLVG